MTDETKSDAALLDSVKQRLSQSEADLDELTLAQLRSARLRAIDQTGKTGASRHWNDWIIPGGAVAMTAVIATVVFNLAVLLPVASPTRQPDLSDGEIISAMDDIHIISAREDLELYEELEFIEWLVLESEQQRG